MSVFTETGYTLPSGDEPMTHARIAHSANWHTGGTITASSTAIGYFADAPDNSLTYEKWKPSTLSATWENDLGSAKIVDYCCIGGHTMGTNGNTLRVEYDSTGAGVWVAIISENITSDEPIYCIFTPSTYQKWRIVVTNGTEPEISAIRFGTSLQMERPIYQGHTPMDMSRKTAVRSNMSESGQWLGRTKVRNALTGSFAWSNLTASWVRSNIKPFIKAVETEPFFIAWRPDTFSEVAYCWTKQNPSGPENTGPRDLMSFTIDVDGLGYE